MQHRYAAHFAAALLVVALFIAAAAAAVVRSPIGGRVHRVLRVDAHPGVDNCTERWFNQTVDHFDWAAPPGGQFTYQQRYFLCTGAWKGGDSPVFFYAGNEADVELYVNASGIMWESAPQFGALLVFAEHRYFGKSQPFGAQTPNNMRYLSSDQALADYATLIVEEFPKLGIAATAPVIAFGGSYGGMLASWLRIKYAHVVDGAVAGSAPIVAYEGMDPPYSEDSYAMQVTVDASGAGGASDACSKNIKSAFQAVFRLGATSEGRSQLTDAFRLCNPLESVDNVTDLAYWAQSSFDYMSMGSYPYPSSYMLNGNGTLPAYPMRVACHQIDGTYHSDAEFASALREAVGVFYNYSGSGVTCFDTHVIANNATAQDALYWSYLACIEQVMPMSRDGVHDMFWPQPWSDAAYVSACEAQWGVTPRPLWAKTAWGGWRIQAASRIVFSNGALDPWRWGGVQSNLSDSLVAVVIDNVGHHMDFMFSDPRDPPAVLQARALERSLMDQWIHAARLERRQRRLSL